MLKLKLFRCKKDNGKTLFSLLDESHFPSIERTLFIHFLSDKATSSIESYIYDLKFFLEMISYLNINIDSLIKSGKVPDEEYINLYIEAAKLKKQHAKNFLKIKSCSLKKKSNRQYTEKQLVDFQYKKNALQPVSINTKNRRLTIAIKYLKFIFNLYIKKPNIEQKTALFTALELLNVAKGRRSKAWDFAAANKKVIPEDKYNKLIEIITPGHPENPFKECQWRNFLIFSIIDIGGIRRGACAKLKLSDIDFTGDCNLVSINRTPDDIDDPRARVPSQKTRAHLMVLQTSLLLELKEYFEISRNKFQNADSHQFIFITEKNSKDHNSGFPLSTSSINYIFKKLSRAIKFRIYPHLLRYHWHTNFEEIAKENNLTEAEIDKITKEAMGWARDSKMDFVYNRPQIIKKMKDAMKKQHDKVYHAK